MPQHLKNEFTASKLRLEHHNPKIFITSQWQLDHEKPSLIYLFARLAIFITFFVIWLLTITMQTTRGRQTWAIYLTNWGFSLCLLQSFMSCLLLSGAVADHFMLGKYNWKNVVDKMYPVYWVLHVLATCVAFTITLIYWTLIFKATGSPWSTMNFMVHGFNSILMTIDFWIVAHPVHILHSCYPVLIGIIYATMTAIYYFCGGLTQSGSPYIYPILKWDEPGATIGYIMGIIVLLMIIHTLTYFMFKLRAKLSPPLRAFVHRKLFTCSDGPYV